MRGHVRKGACGGIFVRFGWGYEIYDKEPGWVDLVWSHSWGGMQYGGVWACA
ncbi:hypothetical protein [Bartonella birtlesii]|uniref:hypothetical protein n=1 Tax=Bartonella birtlesii TaxID=111504 RepID=UPI0003FC39FC|nr:hypothetical protein [Bartonella birtlesii]